MLPIGVSNFATLVTHKDPTGNHYLFVDKSLFIRDFISSGDEITLITRPRRFGKTINLSMLQHFFAKEVNGRPTKWLFDHLKINEYPEIMAYQGQFPVIFLTLKEVRGQTFEIAFSRVKEIMRALFQTHRYLLDENLADEDRIFFEKILNKETTQGEYETAIQDLSRLLYQYTGKKAIILLDEYDTPLHDAYIQGYYEDMRSFMATVFNKTFKGNSFLHKALITGILKIAKSSLFSELNNVKDYTTLRSPRYAQYFGFTEEETNDYLDRADLPQRAHELKEMYNGYQIEEYTLYNPFSIVSFIDTAVIYGPERLEEALKPYWINSGGHGLIRELASANRYTYPT